MFEWTKHFNLDNRGRIDGQQENVGIPLNRGRLVHVCMCILIS